MVSSSRPREKRKHFLAPALPVSRPPLRMCDNQHLNSGFNFPKKEIVGIALQNCAAKNWCNEREVAWIPANLGLKVGNFVEEADSGLRALFSIPVERRIHFGFSLGVKRNPWHQPSAGDTRAQSRLDLIPGGERCLARVNFSGSPQCFGFPCRVGRNLSRKNLTSVRLGT
jgi:hypothetical protein